MDDFILNGRAVGSVASRLLAANFDMGVLRPYIGNDGRSYITVNQNGKPVAMPITNADATLRKYDWEILDEAIIKAAKPRLRAVADLRSRGLTFSVPNGMGKTVLESQNQSDVSAAVISMDGLRQSQSDRPVFDLVGLPLPIIHKDFQFSARQIASSRNGGSPLDTSTAELASRRVSEMAEQMLLGTAADYGYAGYTIQGYTSYTNRLMKTITAPTASGWTGATTVAEVLEMRQQSRDAFYYGPWMLYNSPAFDVYLDEDYSTLKGDLTLRDRLKKIGDIQDVRTLDYLTGYTLLLVQMTSDVVREVIGMDVTTVQWESQGGMQLNFKVMCIMVPQIRTDYNGNTGIVHGATA
jgi:uncharacterized linocin/CFP29 family protein